MKGNSGLRLAVGGDLALEDDTEARLSMWDAEGDGVMVDVNSGTRHD